MAVTISVTQGLAELKLLDKRLDKALSGTMWTSVLTKTNKVDAEKFARTAQAEYQSYTALFKRRLAIKQAIVSANAMSRVTVGKWEGSVAEAIEYKNSISYKKTLLDKMKSMWMTSQAEMERQMETVNRRLDTLLQSELGKDVRTNPETITALTTSFRENNKVELVDPLDLSTKIKELEQEIDEFEANVDWALSEANAKSMIQVPA